MNSTLDVKVPNGFLNTTKLEMLKDILSRYGCPWESDVAAYIIDRQKIQLRGISLKDLPDIKLRLRAAKMDTIGSFDNIVGNPLANSDPDEILDTLDVTRRLDEYLSKEFPDELPHKWNIGVAGGPRNFVLYNDIVFHSKIRKGYNGMSVWVGGSAEKNILAVPLKLWVEYFDINRLTGVIINLCGESGCREYLDKVGINKFRWKVRWKMGWFGSSLRRDPGEPFNTEPLSYFGVYPSKIKGFQNMGCYVEGGRLTEDDLDFISEKCLYGSSEIRLTEDKHFILAMIRDNKLERMLKSEKDFLDRFPPYNKTIGPGPYA